MACTEIILVRCPDCDSENIKRNGKSKIHQQRYSCKCCKRSFQRQYQRKAWMPEVRRMVVRMTMHNSGIRDIEDVLDIHRDSVMAAIQRAADAIPTSPAPKARVVRTAELDEFWSFVRSKEHQRWTWYAWDDKRKRVLAYCNGRRTDASCKALCKELFANYDIRRYNTDNWQSYHKVLPPEKHRVSKKGTQRIERQNLNFRTHLKRLNRQTICFSKSEVMHDAVIKLYIYRINTRKQYF
ncbi:MAG: IS1 family transposase [Candidatus Kapaibacterium sp.]|nr:MAG: IS1 family transposase [Candidatus Kapabacteria bacterium]